MTRVLITGATGFIGSNLADYLIEQGLEVHGIRRPRSRDEFVRPDVVYHETDILDYTGLATIIKQVKPDFVFHLAAQSYVPLSWGAPNTTMLTNVMGTLHVLEAIKNAVKNGCPEAVVQTAGSSEEYGLVYPEECPVKESQPFRPQSPYGVSKVATDLLSQQYHRSFGLKTVITRCFNTTGPRRGELFVTSKIAKQLALCGKKGQPHTLVLGNLEASRDFTDVRDVVRALWLAVNKCKHGKPYNIGSGKSHTVRELVDLFAEITGRIITVAQDPELMRPSDVPLLTCDSTLFRETTGWQPTYTLKQTLSDLLDYWREKLGR